MDPTQIVISKHALSRFKQRFGVQFTVQDDQQAINMIVWAIAHSKPVHRNKAKRYGGHPRIAHFTHKSGTQVQIVMLFRDKTLVSVFRET